MGGWLHALCSVASHVQCHCVGVQVNPEYIINVPKDKAPQELNVRSSRPWLVLLQSAASINTDSNH